MRRTAAWWAMLVIVLAASATAHAQGDGLDAGEPIGVKVWAYVGAAPKGVVPADKWVVEVKGKQVKLQVVKLDVLTGNTFYMNIFAKLDPYPIALNFVGHELDKILDAAPGQEISIIGELQFGGGARLFMISTVTAEGTPVK